MAPIKFDEQIKEKLEKRQLSPSDDAWNKLSDRLDTVETSSKKRSIWKLGIAASIVGILFLITFLNNKQEPIETLPEIVDTETKLDVEGSNNKQEQKSILADIEKTEDKREINNSSKDNKAINTEKKKSQQTLPKAVIEKKQKELVNSKELEVIANVQKKAMEDSKKENKELNKSTFEDIKAKQVVAQILDIKAKKSTVTEAEIDALLNAAYKEITLKKLLKDDNTIDANLLLQDVENELEQSFRTRVFEMLKSSYKEIKTAVAERNN